MSEPFVIACVKWGERYGAYWVNTLFDMVRRHLPGSFDVRFECFTDDAAGLDASIIARKLPGDLAGWWNKLYLFKEGVFVPGQRVLYLDLDTIITGSLADIVSYAGNLALLRDFYRSHGFGSGVMLWRAGACDGIWSRYANEGKPQLGGGDQAWLEIAAPDAGILQELYPGAFASFKADCHPLPPEGTRVLCFHGEPKQDNCAAPWVRDIWKPNGALTVLGYATRQEELEAHRLHAAGLPNPKLKKAAAHERHAVIVGSGATLEGCEDELRGDQAKGHDLFAANNAAAWLAQKNIAFTAQVIGDALKGAHVSQGVVHYCSSTSHPDILAQPGEGAVIFEPACEDSSTTGLQAIHLAWQLGYRHFHLYGMDSCFYDGAHHATRQPLSDRIYSLEFHGRRFTATAWMLAQAEEFGRLADRLLAEGCTISIHGDGLLRFIASRIF